MTHHELYAEACRKAFEGYILPERIGIGRWGKPVRNAWTREEAEILLSLARSGMRSYEIAKEMNKSPKAIQKAFVRFRFPRLHNICPPTGPDCPSWNGGCHYDKNGYLYRRCTNHPYANHLGYVFEHRLIVEAHLGRYLLPSEVVHHIDGDRTNNDIGNLEVFSSNGEHLRATLTGISHNVSPEGRRILSENSKIRTRLLVQQWKEEGKKQLFVQWLHEKRISTLQK